MRIQLLTSLLAEYESQENANAPEIAAIRADLFLRLGMLHRYLGELHRALEYYEKSLAIQREIGDRAGLIPALHNMAHIYQAQNQVQESLERFAEALQLSLETNRPYDVFDESRHLGALMCRFGDKKQGLPLLQQALEVGQQIGHPGLSQVEELLRQYS